MGPSPDDPPPEGPPPVDSKKPNDCVDEIEKSTDQSDTIEEDTDCSGKTEEDTDCSGKTQRHADFPDEIEGQTDTESREFDPVRDDKRGEFDPVRNDSATAHHSVANGNAAERAPRRAIDSTECDPTTETVPLTPRMLLANVAFTQLLVVAVLLGAAWYFSIPAWAFGVATGEAMSTGLQGVAIGVAFGVVLWLANELATTIADAVGAAYDETVREMLAPETPQGWLFLFGGVLPLIAFAEELLFRAALIGVPAAGFDVSPWLLAVVSSLAFALGHGAQGRVGIVVTGVLGLALAGGYILTGSLLVVVVAHYVINAMEFFVHELLGVEALLFSSVSP